MNDRDEELRRLAADLRRSEAIGDVFLAKSFSDRLLVVDTTDGQAVPEDVLKRLSDHHLYGAEYVYGDDDDESQSFAGFVGDAARHHFVDVETQGRHQSYVVE